MLDNDNKADPYLRMLLCFGFDVPEPSLCDTCVYAGEVGGGSASFGGKTYAQRYCSRPEIIDRRESCLHSSGKQTCEFHTERLCSSCNDSNVTSVAWIMYSDDSRGYARSKEIRLGCDLHPVEVRYVDVIGDIP